MSSRGSPPFRLTAASASFEATSSALPPPALSSCFGSQSGIVLAGAIGEVEHPIRVEDERVADAEAGVDVGEVGGGEGAEQGARLAELFDAAALPQHQGWRVSAEGDRQSGGAPAVPRGLDAGEGRGAEAKVGALAA